MEDAPDEQPTQKSVWRRIADLIIEFLTWWLDKKEKESCPCKDKEQQGGAGKSNLRVKSFLGWRRGCTCKSSRKSKKGK